MLQRRFILFIMVFCLFWLVACEQAVPESVPTATAVLPQPIATPTTPPTALPSATMVETAVATYLDLIQQAPSSPWSWLAWARLEPEP